MEHAYGAVAANPRGGTIAAVEPARGIESDLRQTIDINEVSANKLRRILDRIRGCQPECEIKGGVPTLDNLGSLSGFSRDTAHIVNNLIDEIAERI